MCKIFTQRILEPKRKLYLINYTWSVKNLKNRIHIVINGGHLGICCWYDIIILKMSQNLLFICINGPIDAKISIWKVWKSYNDKFWHFLLVCGGHLVFWTMLVLNYFRMNYLISKHSYHSDFGWKFLFSSFLGPGTLWSRLGWRPFWIWHCSKKRQNISEGYRS